MAASSPNSSTPDFKMETGFTTRLLKIATIWHYLLSAFTGAGIIVLWFASVEIPAWQRIVMTLVLAVVAGMSIYTAALIPRRIHRGRVISLVINYLALIGFLLSWMHFFGIFTGIDDLANVFGKGLPFIGSFVVGFLINGLNTRFENYPDRQQLFIRAGNAVMILSLIAFLLTVGLINGIFSAFSQLNSPFKIFLTIGVLLFAAACWMMWRQPSAKAMHESSKDQEMLNGYLFLSPNLLGFLFFFAGPLLLSLFVSFTNADGFGNQEWVGLDNYAEIFNLEFATLDSPDQPARDVIDITVYDELWRGEILGKSFLVGAEDKLFWISLRNTLVFVLTAVPLSVIPALLLASVLNSGIPGMKVFRAIYFIPSVAAVVGVALIWQWLYNSTVGWINYLILKIVDLVNAVSGVETLINPQIGWLSDSNVALFSVVIIAAWQWLGFNTILYLAGLQNIPKSLYEAAAIDGADGISKFFRITVPLLAPQTFFVLSTTTIQAMQVFDQVVVLTEPPGGPGTSTLTMVLYLYNQGFKNFRQGYASSIAWVLFALILGLTLLQFNRQRGNQDA